MADWTELDPIMQSIRQTRGQSVQIAAACGIDKAAVYQWKRVPAHWVQKVARIIGRKPEEIRPDIFKPSRTRRRAKEG
jgi:hypothetical protein